MTQLRGSALRERGGKAAFPCGVTRNATDGADTGRRAPVAAIRAVARSRAMVAAARVADALSTSALVDAYGSGETFGKYYDLGLHPGGPDVVRLAADAAPPDGEPEQVLELADPEVDAVPAAPGAGSWF